MQRGLAVLAALAALGTGGRAVGVGGRLQVLVLPSNPRVLVFAPHPDDETLALGGLLFRLTHQRGAVVRIVFVTNGDGWPWAVQEDFNKPRPNDTDYLALGELRQREALAATRFLGLPRGDVRFLGFPDGGLAELWQAHWSRTNPYTSPYTREDSPPYPGSLNPDVDYDGQDLSSVITRVLRDFRPTIVVVPHPYDAHLDHAHTSYFVIDALQALQDRHVLPHDLLVLTYLVHSPVWPPAAHGPADRLSPPPAGMVGDTRWLDVELSAAERTAKGAALDAYQSQLEASPDLLHRFLRTNELLGRVKSRVLGAIAAVH